MRIILSIVVLFGFLACKAQLNPQSKKVTEKFFPEMEIEINTPAFQKKKGYTTYEELVQFCNSLVSAHSAEVKMQFIGESQKGKKIPMLVYNRPTSKEKKVKVWIQGGLHGNELGSTESVLYMMDQILNNEKYSTLLNRLEIAFVPMANIDGYEKQDRYAANGLDLNRDQTKLNIQESVYLKQAFSDFNAEVALDFHEYKPYRKDFVKFSTYGITTLYDAMFLYSGNLNVPQSLRSYTKEYFVDAAKKELEKNGLRHYDYMSTSKHLGDIHFNLGSENPRSSASSYALTNCVSSLIEVRGVDLGKTSFKRRINTAFIIGMSYLTTAYNSVDEVKTEIQKAKDSKHPAAAKTVKKVYQDSIQVIDLDKNEEISLEITIRDALQLTSKLSRERPKAYLILATELEVIDKLKVLGLEVKFLEKELTVEVESYVVSNYEQAAEKYEGVVLQTVSTNIENETKSFPVGTALVDLNQIKANLAIEVLEPEVKNSFVSFSVIRTELGKTLPIYRVLKAVEL